MVYHTGLSSGPANDLARENDGEIVVMNVVTVPPQTPLSEGRAFVDEEREILDRAIEIGDAADVPVSGTIRMGHEVSGAILNTIDHRDVAAVLMGWRGRSRRQDFVFGSNVDEVITKARCDVRIESVGAPTGPVDELLLPTEGGPHADLAARVGRGITRENDATVDIVNVVPPDASAADREAARPKVESTARILADSDQVGRSSRGRTS